MGVPMQPSADISWDDKTHPQTIRPDDGLVDIEWTDESPSGDAISQAQAVDHQRRVYLLAGKAINHLQLYVKPNGANWPSNYEIRIERDVPGGTIDPTARATRRFPTDAIDRGEVGIVYTAIMHVQPDSPLRFLFRIYGGSVSLYTKIGKFWLPGGPS